MNASIPISKYLMLCGIMIMLTGCGLGTPQANFDVAVPTGIVSSEGISIDVYDYESLKPMLKKDNDTLYVFNFWASWCVPCVKELPFFEKANESYAGQKVKIVLISLDFSEDIEGTLIPFIKEHNIRSQVINLDDPDANNWIPQVDPGWDGAIPATLFKRGDKKQFMARPLTYAELRNEIDKLLKL